MDIAIETHELSKQYRNQAKDHPAVYDLNLEIPEGQMYGLVGPDGAGKTTTIRILSTIMKQTLGSARVAGYDVLSEAEKARLHIGYMPQAYSLYPDLTVMENLDFFADIHAIPAARRESRIAELMAFTRLGQFKNRTHRKLSGGMRKKLALACALVHEPSVLLLDEPTTGVDPVSRRELWLMLGEVVEQGVAVLVSTPYMDEAERCHKVGIIYEGTMLVSGSPEELESRLPFRILEVKAKPRRLMRQVISEMDSILQWRPVGDRLRLAVKDVERVQSDLQTRLSNAGADIKIMRQAKLTMEDVFVYQVKKQRGGK